MTQSGRHAQTVIKNANIITIDPRTPKASSLAISDGKFIAIGDNTACDSLIGPDTEVLNLSGKTVLPGFIDAHIHVLNSGIRHVMAADCDLPNIPLIQQALRDRIKETLPGGWIQGFKFDDTKTQEKRFLFKSDLDAVTTEYPIMVAHRAGHIYYLNSTALAAANFDDNTPDPPGGRLGRDPDTGGLNGVVYERAIEPIRFGLIPPETPDIRQRGLITICKMLNQVGLTSVHDARVIQTEFDAYQNGLDNAELTLRVYALMYHPHFEALKNAGIKTGFGNEFLRIGGIKMIADGAIAARTAYISEPYIGSDCDHGILAMTQEEIETNVINMHNAGFQVCIHANGDLTIDMVLDAYMKAQKLNPRTDTRHRIEHCSLVNPDILRKMRESNTIATPFCTYVYHHGEKMPFFGEERLKWMFAQKSFLDYGIISTGATDYPPGPFEPLLGIQSCVTRTDSNGKTWGVEQQISVDEALKIYTLNGAYASFEENIKGSITEGKLADLVILSDDPRTVDPNTIKDIPVERTILGGNTVFEK